MNCNCNCKNGIIEINSCSGYCACGGCVELKQCDCFDLDKLEKNLDFQYMINLDNDNLLYFVLEVNGSDFILEKSELIIDNNEDNNIPYELTPENLNALYSVVEKSEEWGDYIANR